MRDNRKQGQRGEVRIEAHIEYRDSSGKLRESPRQTIRVNIFGKEVHEEIPNPFTPYAGGLPVTSAEMFFGRQPLVEEFVKGLGGSRGSVCYALYGQQRTGKSSVLHQVQSQLRDRGAVVASMSMGTMDRYSITLGFVEEVLDQFRAQIDALLPQELSTLLLAHWPDAPAIERRPLRSLQRAIEAARGLLNSANLRPPFIVVIDEFTYLFEILRRDGVDPREHNELRDFMRQFKSLLEAGRFSALLSGQDTMPRFLASFPNEFSVMATRRLDYLTREEGKELADLPIARGEDSRYTGYALDTLVSYTDGHPFFTQILCDRVVTLVNEKRRSRITESDVEEAVESLLNGAEAIEPHRFDCLVSADNSYELVADIEVRDDLGVRAVNRDGSKRAQAVLTRLALMSGSQNSLVHIDDLELDARDSEALDDLRLRGVLHEVDGGVKIRVLLYADYLRRAVW